MNTIKDSLSSEAFYKLLERQIQHCIKEEAEKLMEKTIKEYTYNLRDQIKALVAQAALNIFSIVKMDFFGTTLRIEVHLPEEK